MNEDLAMEDLKRSKLIKRKANKFLNDYFGWLILAVIFIVLAAGFIIVLKPRYDQTMTIISIFNRQEALDFENKKNELAKINELLSSYKSIDDKYKNKISSIVPKRKNKEEIFSEINRLVKQNGLLLEGISLSSGGGNVFLSASDPNLEIITVKFKVRGADYEAFKNFLSAMENNLPLLDVLSLSFSPSAKTVDFIIDTYYLRE